MKSRSAAWSPSCLSWIAAFLVVCGAASSHVSATVPPSSESPTDAMARLHASLRQLERAYWDSLGDGPDGMETYRQTGQANEATQRWLAESRPLVRELESVSTQLPPRALQYDQGFALLMPHLQISRDTARCLSALAEDAAIRGDRDALLEFTQAQTRSALDVANDGITISSLVSIAQSRLLQQSIQHSIDRGDLNAESASAVLEASKPLHDGSVFALEESAQREGEVLRGELAQLSTMDSDARAASLAKIGMDAQTMDLSDSALAECTDKSSAYFDALASAAANPDRATGRAEVAALNARMESGEFGALLKNFAPAFDRALDHVDRLEHDFAAQTAVLQAIADSSKQPEDFMNAAPLYLAALREMARLTKEQQCDIEAVRLASAQMPEEMQRNVRRTIEDFRAGVIDRVTRAVQCARCEFDDRVTRDPTFLMTAVVGMHGAVRVLLYDALLPQARAEQSMSAVESVVVALSVLQQFAASGSLGRALVAQQIARDCSVVLTELTQRNVLDEPAKEKLTAALSCIAHDDPFGFRRALVAERARITQWNCRVEMEEGAQQVPPISPEYAKKMPVHALSFVLGLSTPRAYIDPSVGVIESTSVAQSTIAPDHFNAWIEGPLVDLRPWFDLDALTLSNAQLIVLHKRLQKLLADGTLPVREALAGSPFVGLTLSVPLDVDAAMARSVEDITLLESLCAVKDRASTRDALSE